MARKWLWRLGAVAGAGALIGIGALAWNTEPGLRLRAALGQDEAQLALVLNDYGAGDLSSAFARLEPLVLDGQPGAVALVCQFLSARPAYPEQGDDCLAPGDTPQMKRLTQLSDLAIFAREWDVLARLLEARDAAGDTGVPFERARAEVLAHAEAPDMTLVLEQLQAAAAATDPRGQYLMAVFQLAARAEGEAAEPFQRTLATLLTQAPPVSAGDAYFELAKMMQNGLVRSDLAYAEVLRRADRLGNPYAAGLIAQYLIANPEMAPVGGLDTNAWLARAAANGDPVARYNRAVQLLSGTPDEAAVTEAEALLRASADTGFAPSATRLGALYWRRPDVAFDTTEAGRQRALALWQQAAEQGDANAYYNLGQVATAQGDTARARAFFQDAADLGHEAAAAALTGTE